MRRVQMLTVAATLAVAVSCKDAATPPTAVIRDMHPSRSVVANPNAPISPAVSAGGWHTCALKTDGSLACWGNNVEGETAIPAGLAPTAQMATGFYSTCAASTSGTVACWGDNYYGESTPPTGISGAVQVSAGFYHACARISDGTVQCWGRDTETEVDVPPGLTGVTQISVGGFHSCALAAGAVVCWGDNDYKESVAPAGLGTVTQLSAGRFHTCALVGSAVTCWGNNDSGESSVPAGLGAVKQVSAGLGQHTCALLTAGTVTCWGDNTYGQAAPPAGLSSVTMVSSGLQHSCAMKSDGSVVCWGNNANGQISIPVNLNLNVVLPQVISFVSFPPNPAYTSTTYTLSATATSGLPVTYKSLTPAVCTLSGATVSFVAVGTCTVAADQAGDPLHLAAPEQTQSFSVAQLQVAQTISFTSTPPSPAYVGASYTLAATSTSGLAIAYSSLTPAICTVTGNVAKFIAAGACTVAADQAGDAGHLAAPEKTQSITVTIQTQAPQTITYRVAPPTTANVGDFTLLLATGGGSNNLVLFTSVTPATCSVILNVVSYSHIGACTIAANQAGNASYAAAPTNNITITVTWAFRGFLGGVSNPPSVNTANSGSSVPIQFRLGGTNGSAIYAAGSPYSTLASCTDWSVTGPPIAAVTANGHDNSKDKDWNKDSDDDDDVYNYVWKTDKSWAKTCRIFTVVLLDGTSHSARFNFNK